MKLLMYIVLQAVIACGPLTDSVESRSLSNAQEQDYESNEISTTSALTLPKTNLDCDSLIAAANQIVLNVPSTPARADSNNGPLYGGNVCPIRSSYAVNSENLADTQLYVFSTDRGLNFWGESPNGLSALEQNRAILRLPPTLRPAIFVVSSKEEVSWEFIYGKETQIAAVILQGPAHARIIGLPSYVPVIRRSNNETCGAHAWQFESNFEYKKMIASIRAFTGLKETSFRGCNETREVSFVDEMVQDKLLIQSPATLTTQATQCQVYLDGLRGDGSANPYRNTGPGCLGLMTITDSSALNAEGCAAQARKVYDKCVAPVNATPTFKFNIQEPPAVAIFSQAGREVARTSYPFDSAESCMIGIQECPAHPEARGFFHEPYANWLRVDETVKPRSNITIDGVTYANRLGYKDLNKFACEDRAKFYAEWCGSSKAVLYSHTEFTQLHVDPNGPITGRQLYGTAVAANNPFACSKDSDAISTSSVGCKVNLDQFGLPKGLVFGSYLNTYQRLPFLNDRNLNYYYPEQKEFLVLKPGDGQIRALAQKIIDFSDIGKRVTYAQANQFCASLPAVDGRAWRLPRIRELRAVSTNSYTTGREVFSASSQSGVADQIRQLNEVGDVWVSDHRVFERECGGIPTVVLRGSAPRPVGWFTSRAEVSFSFADVNIDRLYCPETGLNPCSDPTKALTCALIEMRRQIFDSYHHVVCVNGAETTDLRMKDWMDRTYTEILGRNATAAEVAAVEVNVSGNLVRKDIVVAAMNSNEGRAKLIKSYYQKFLGRLPGQAEIDYYINDFKGKRHEQIMAQFANSPEYFARGGGTNEGWVKFVYRDILGREADAAGIAFWVGHLQSGTTRYAVAYGFLTSDEYRRNLIRSWHERAFGRAIKPALENDYLSYIKRTATLDEPQSNFYWNLEYFQKTR